jgi:hypothetical protein
MTAKVFYDKRGEVAYITLDQQFFDKADRDRNGATATPL